MALPFSYLNVKEVRARIELAFFTPAQTKCIVELVLGSNPALNFLFPNRSDAVPQVQVWGTTFSEFYYAFCNFVIRRPYWQIFGQLLGNATDRMSSKWRRIISAYIQRCIPAISLPCS